MAEKHYCPVCMGELEMLSGCGAVGYFCNHCRKLVSRSKMLTEAQRQEASGQGTKPASQDEKK